MLPTMQALIANAFAATATFLVVAFPTPDDLKRALVGNDFKFRWQENAATAQLIDFRETGSPEVSEVVSLQGIGASEDGDYIALLNGCAFYISRSDDPDTAACAEAIDAISGRFVAPLDAREFPILDPLSEAYLLAKAELCRVEWGRQELDPSAIRQACLD